MFCSLKTNEGYFLCIIGHHYFKYMQMVSIQNLQKLKFWQILIKVLLGYQLNRENINYWIQEYNRKI